VADFFTVTVIWCDG